VIPMIKITARGYLVPAVEPQRPVFGMSTAA
jgi:hypothetical protein